MTKAAIWSLLDQNRTFIGMFFSPLKICPPFFGQNFDPIFHARINLVSPNNKLSCQKIWSNFCQKTDQRFWPDIFLTKIGPNYFATWFVFWTNQMISSMKNWVQNFVQKLMVIFSRVKKTYPWMSDFHLTKTKLQLLSSFTTITLPLAFISIWYLP